MRLSVFTLLFALVAAGCATKWVHPDPDADWDATYAECAPEAEAAGSDEIDKQVVKACLEEKGWVEEKTGTRRPSSRARAPRPHSRHRRRRLGQQFP